MAEEEKKPIESEPDGYYGEDDVDMDDLDLSFLDEDEEEQD